HDHATTIDVEALAAIGTVDDRHAQAARRGDLSSFERDRLHVRRLTGSRLGHAPSIDDRGSARSARVLAPPVAAFLPRGARAAAVLCVVGAVPPLGARRVLAGDAGALAVAAAGGVGRALAPAGAALVAVAGEIDARAVAEGLAGRARRSRRSAGTSGIARIA